MKICYTCKKEISEGTERAWGKTAFKCDPCAKLYVNTKKAERLAKERGPDWKPKSVPRHALLNCNGWQHRCTGCNKMKIIEEFPNNKETPCGKDPRCKQCRHKARRERMGAVKENPRCQTDEERVVREKAAALRYREKYPERLQQTYRSSKLKGRFNLSMDQYAWLQSTQNSLCFLCNQPETRVHQSGTVNHLSIDHDHRCCSEAGKSCGKCIRHLLCTMCNTILGYVEDKPALLPRFADYVDLRPLDNYPGEGNW